jgi:CRP/FNR family cyclic AMP-dependent transcriptional regulator
MSVRADVETIRNIPIFSECEAAHLQLLAFSATRENFEPGRPLLVQGDTGNAAYLVLSGTVEISSAGSGALGVAGPGALLGEVAMIGGSPYSITARAVDAVATARIDRELFLRVAREFPEFGTAVLRSLSRKLETAVEDLSEARQLFQKARSFRSL